MEAWRLCLRPQILAFFSQGLELANTVYDSATHFKNILYLQYLATSLNNAGAVLNSSLIIYISRCF